jgi:hypothetical protein
MTVTKIAWTPAVNNAWGEVPDLILVAWLDLHGAKYVVDDFDYHRTAMSDGHLEFANPLDAIAFKLKFNL